MKKSSPLRLVKQLIFVATLLLCFHAPLSAGNPYSAYYSADSDKLLWFIHASDAHIGTSGSTDSTNLQWLVGQAKSVINPSFFVVSGDLTDSTNGNIFGYPNGPYQAEWDQYKSIVDGKVSATIYFDIPGNHDAYNDRYFAYYLANSVQGRATGRTQASWTRSLASGDKYHFLGVNTADNTGAGFSIFWPYGDYAGLDSSELSFINSELNGNMDASLTLVFGHHPLAATGNSQDTYLYYGKDEFVSLMNSHGSSLYGYGHTHVSSEQYFSQNMTSGVFYFNVSALGKNSPNQYTVTAIDCNGISSVTQTVGNWPVVLITAPMDRRLGGVVNPYAYTVDNGASNPIRALVFDPTAISQVQFRINGGAWQSMTAVPGKPYLWQGTWNASSMPDGEAAIDVQATTGSGTRSDRVTTYVKSQTLPAIKVGNLITGIYVTTGTKKNKITTFQSSNTFTPGQTVVFRGFVADSTGKAVANATVQLAISGPLSTTLTSTPSDSSGIAEATWATTAPNKRGVGGTPTGSYTATVTGVTAAGHQWDGAGLSVSFTITSK